jgi:SAM-dependent methyltransferase
MKNWLRNISDADFGRFLGFADRHLGIVKRDHVLQKLTIFNFVAPIIERYKPQTILEIGCGLGFHAALLTRYGQVSATELQVPGSFVTMDKDVASNRATVFGELADGPVQFQVNDGRIFPFADNSFDLIFHNSVIEHVPDATAFNRETRRLLKPGGIVVCITGTPALCRFRFLRDYILRLPFTIAASVIKEAGVTSRSKVSDKIKALLPKNAPKPARLPSVAGWNARLTHYVNSPVYNHLVLEELAKDAGIDTGTAVVAAHEHFRGSILHRFAYYLTPQTHGQHYRDFRHEMSEWKLDRWRGTFTSAGFEVVDLVPYRFHHILEPTWSGRINSALYLRAAPLIERFCRSIPPGFSSEFILVARMK